MKLHLCCGDIYLEGYLNLDIKGQLVNKSSIKDLNKNKTTLSNYFKHPFGSPRRKIIVDKNMDLLKSWKLKKDSIDGIVMISGIEHFYLQDAKFIISEIKRVLKPNGKLIIDFPDIKKQIKLYYDKDPNFCMELIYCNHKDIFSAHHWGYTTETFFELLGNGWKSMKKKTIVKHAYPMIGIVAIKG